jgi:UDP-galactopyranose mutase
MASLVIDKRPHIGGNAYDRLDEQGVLVHPYGPHIFHTNSEQVWGFLSQFTSWRPYEHRVLAKVGEQLLPIPINRHTLNQLYGLTLNTDDEAQAYFDAVRQPVESVRSSEDLVLSAVGSDLCEKFFRGYTRKQWGLDLSELAAGVAARIPTRTNLDDRYFTDRFQAMPSEGYTAMFSRILDHPLIKVELATDYFAEQARSRALEPSNYRHTVYSGPLDLFFEHCYGPLPYRSLRFEHQHLAHTAQYQAVGTVNFPNEHDYTRITEFKHLTGQSHQGTSIVREFPMAEGEPFYPVPRPENDALFKRYQALADACTEVSFVGRLAQYRYYNMDQVVAAALALGRRLVERLRGEGALKS